MIWFDRLFPVFMLLWPAVFTSCVRVHPTRAEPDHRAALARLWRFTALAIVAFVAGQLALEATFEERTGLRAGWPVINGTAVSMLLFFRLAAPALVKRSPGWNEMSTGLTTRGASLTPRDDLRPLPGWAVPTGWLVFAICAGALGWAVWQGGQPVLLIGLASWPGMALGCHFAVREPEPLDAGGSAELLAAYATARSLKAWGFWCLGVTMTLGFAIVGVLSLSVPMTAGWVGAIGGSAIGLAGGVFGCVASITRARIHERLQDLGAE